MKDLIICVQLYLLLLIKARFKMDMHIQMLNVNDKLRSPGGLMKLIMSRDIVTKDEDMCVRDLSQSYPSLEEDGEKLFV